MKREFIIQTTAGPKPTTMSREETPSQEFISLEARYIYLQARESTA